MQTKSLHTKSKIDRRNPTNKLCVISTCKKSSTVKQVMTFSWVITLPFVFFKWLSNNRFSSPPTPPLLFASFFRHFFILIFIQSPPPIVKLITTFFCSFFKPKISNSRFIPFHCSLVLKKFSTSLFIPSSPCCLLKTQEYSEFRFHEKLDLMLQLTPKDKFVGGPPKRKEIKQEPRETEKPKMFYFSTWAMVLNREILEMTTKTYQKGDILQRAPPVKSYRPLTASSSKVTWQIKCFISTCRRARDTTLGKTATYCARFPLDSLITWTTWGHVRNWKKYPLSKALRSLNLTWWWYQEGPWPTNSNYPLITWPYEAMVKWQFKNVLSPFLQDP